MIPSQRGVCRNPYCINPADGPLCRLCLVRVEAACRGKRRHDSREAAWAFERRGRRWHAGHEPCQPYRCGLCGWHHLGHPIAAEDSAEIRAAAASLVLAIGLDGVARLLDSWAGGVAA